MSPRDHTSLGERQGQGPKAGRDDGRGGPRALVSWDAAAGACPPAGAWPEGHGEDGWIATIAAVLGGVGQGEGVERGIGDDAAVLVAPPGGRLVATVDMVVEGQHFLLEGPAAATLGDVGWRALAVNLSDVAAMGARPLWAMVSLGVPAHVGAPGIAALYAGMRALAAAHGVAVVGGNLARLRERLVVDVALIGHADRPVLRGGARAGDRLLVTGRVGAAAAGLALAAADVAAWPDLCAGWLRPRPRVAEGRVLGGLPAGFIRAACDISDGLVRDAARLCGPGVGLVLWREALPIPASVGAAAARLGGDALQWALYGGEDYELALAVAPEAVAAVQSALGGPGLAGAHVVGAFSGGPPEVAMAERAGAPSVALTVSGWDPFASHGGAVREGQEPAAGG